MISTGIDLIEISRIRKSMQNERFIQRIFGNSELAELELTGFSAQRAAALFAAKEAFGKALGLGISGFSFKDVEVLHNSTGMPFLIFSGKAKELVENKAFRFSLSITHTKDYAACVVVAYNEE